jgi:hypothetical protein
MEPFAIARPGSTAGMVGVPHGEVPLTGRDACQVTVRLVEADHDNEENHMEISRDAST